MNNKTKTKLEGFLEDGYLVENPVALQVLSIAIYRLLAKGNAVSLADITSTTRLNISEVEDLIKLVPESAYDRASGGDFVSYIGLSIHPEAHQFKVAGRTLYTWCVFDALFLPAILRQQAILTTACPSTGRKIELTISPSAVESATLPQPVMSIIAPNRDACCSDLRGAFCNHVNFFADQEAFLSWNNRSDADNCICLEDAFALAMRRNKARFPDAPLATAN